MSRINRVIIKSFSNVAVATTKIFRVANLHKLGAMLGKYLLDNLKNVDLRLPDESFGPIEPLCKKTFKDDFDDS